MIKKFTNYGKAAMLIGFITLLLLAIMNTEISFHPFSIHIHKAEKLMEVFIQVCAFLFFDYHGRWEGFKEGSMTVINLIEDAMEKADKEQAENNQANNQN